MNPSNQPEPNQTQVNYPGNAAAHQRDIEGVQQNTPAKESVSPRTAKPGTTSSIPDAQAELGLQKNWLDSALLSFASLYAEGDLDAAEAGRKAILAAVEADKAAAVVEELQTLKNLCMMPGTTVSGLNRVIGTHIARLQPPTAGEGESV